MIGGYFYGGIKGGNMKYFDVRKEELRGSLVLGLIYSDGEYSEEANETDIRTLTMGFDVVEYSENGMAGKVNFYPVKINAEDWTTNEDEVLKQIKEDYSPEKGWQNNNW